jgi:hypothetical protein
VLQRAVRAHCPAAPRAGLSTSGEGQPRQSRARPCSLVPATRRRCIKPLRP